MLFCASWENDSTEGNYVAFYQKATSERLELALIQHKWEKQKNVAANGWILRIHDESLIG